MITPTFSDTSVERVLPRLALNFTSAVLDSRVSFTRALNTATRVNSNGYIENVLADVPRFNFNPTTLVCQGLLIEESRVNSFINSNDFNSWTKNGGLTVSSDASLGPDGLVSMDKLIEGVGSNQFNVSASLTIADNTNYTVSVFGKAAERNWLQIRFRAKNNTVIRAWFNISAGVLGSVSGAVVSRSIQNFGGGVYRCIATFNSATGATTPDAGIQVNSLDNQTTYTGNGASGIFVWGAQVEAGSFATSYIPTAASPVTRNADVAVMTGTNFSDWWQLTQGAVAVQVLPSTVSGICPAVEFDDGTADNAIVLRGNGANPELYIRTTTDQAQIDAGTLTANTQYVLAAAWNTDNCAAAVNGAAAVTDLSATIPTVTQARLGSDGTNYLNGHLQTLRYWPQRLINAEVQAFSK